MYIVYIIMMPFCGFTVIAMLSNIAIIWQNIVEYRDNVISVIAQAYILCMHTANNNCSLIAIFSKE